MGEMFCLPLTCSYLTFDVNIRTPTTSCLSYLANGDLLPVRNEGGLR